MSTGGLVPLKGPFDDEVDLVLGNLGEDWQRNGGSGVSLGGWYWTGDPSLPTPRISFLLMNGNRVMAFGVDTSRVQEF